MLQSWSEERIESAKNVDALSRTIAKMEDNVKQQEETQEPREEVLAMYDRYRKLYSEAKAAITEIQTNVTALDAAIRLRKEGYKFILRCTCKNVSE
jgi:exonuclease VII small subunit